MGDNMIIFNKEVDQSDLTSECWDIQLRGIEACKTCEFLNTPSCGGKQIIKKLTNNKGVPVPIGRDII